MKRIRFGRVFFLVWLVGVLSIAPSAFADAPSLQGVEWVHTEDFSGYAVGEFPSANWTTMVAERKATWNVVEFPQSETGYALRGRNVGFNPNRAIMLVDVPQVGTGKIVVEVRIWLDGAGLPGIDLFNPQHRWPNYISIHPWNLGRFASGTELKAYDVVAIFDLGALSADVYVNGELFKGDIPFREGQTPPAEGIYHVGVVFNNDNDATDLFYERIRVGVME